MSDNNDKALAEVLRIAHEAGTKADSTDVRVTYHEKECAIRYDHIKHDQQETIQAINKMHTVMDTRWDVFWARAWKTTGLAFVLLFSILTAVLSYIWSIKVG